MPVTDKDIETFIQQGAAIVDGLLPDDIIDIASKGMDELYENHPERHTGIIGYPQNPGLEQLYQHPGLEEAAKKILGSDEVEFASAATLHTLPTDGEWSYNPESEHVDIQYTTNEWLEIPRRINIMFMVFLDDIPADRGPTVVRPGSHLQIAETLGDAAPYTDHPVNIKDLPKLDYAEPVPVSGKKGQVAIGSTAVIHAGSKNVSDKARKMLFINYTIKNRNLRFNVEREDLRAEFLEAMYERFPEDRKYLVKSALDTLKANPDYGKR
ncbi:MAG: hypothetical protein GKR89_20740 [Candidatus Latescibacteria bacterium]|nr:hypothetical protein [Candidatus Latescibacterota bacterium]